MNSAADEAHERASIELDSNSTIEIIIPSFTNLGIEEVLRTPSEWKVEGTSPLSQIDQRQLLFFDEEVDLLIAVRTRYFEETTLRLLLERLVIVVEAKVLNALPEGREDLSQQEVIYSAVIPESEEPVVMVRPPDEDEDDGGILAIWKVPVLVNRPTKLRPQSPTIAFTTRATLKARDQVNNGETEYMPSRVPSALNLLESFANDPTLKGVTPRLSALRVSRVVPSTRHDTDLVQPFKIKHRRILKVRPALNARIRYAKPNSTPSNPAIIVSLDVEINPSVTTDLTIEAVSLNVQGGNVKDLNLLDSMALPMSCSTQDEVTFLYAILPLDPESSTFTFKPIRLQVDARVQVSDTCTPLVSLKWTSSVDVSIPLNPSYNAPSTTLQRDKRPNNLSISSTISDTALSITSSVHPDALPSQDVTTRHPRSTSIPDFGITMTFTSLASTSSPPKPGDLFRWEVFIVNRSERPRKLALIVIPQPRRSQVDSGSSHNRSISTTSAPGSSPENDIAVAVIDENILHAIQRNAAIEPADVVCMSPDVRIGPLAPSACHTTELTFRALRPGHLRIECVRVVEVGTQDYVDVRTLPNVYVASGDLDTT